MAAERKPDRLESMDVGHPQAHPALPGPPDHFGRCTAKSFCVDKNAEKCFDELVLFANVMHLRLTKVDKITTRLQNKLGHFLHPHLGRRIFVRILLQDPVGQPSFCLTDRRCIL